MEMTAHIIWHAVPNDRISDAKEVVGVVTTGWQDADAVVEKLNSEDDAPSWSRRRNYWKEEVSALTLATV